MAEAKDWIDRELQRRRDLWRQVHEQGGPHAMRARTIQDLGLYRGMAGIFRDKANTATADLPNGLAITFLHTGTSYADDLSEDGLTYHYPSTSRPGNTDEGEIESAKAAHRAGIPVFVSAAKPKDDELRDLHLGYIEQVNDDLREFLVTFVEDVRPRRIDTTLSEEPFQLLGADAQAVLAMVKRRPNQQRFTFHVMQRYGRACAVCRTAVPEYIQAAHITPKSARGSDDPRNGLPLCANHHVAYDAGLWAVDPVVSEIVTRRNGPSGSDLGISQTDLTHLPELPHDDALVDAWERWRKKYGG